MRIFNANCPLVRRQGDLFGHNRAHRPAAKGVGDELLALVVRAAKGPKDLSGLDIPAVAGDWPERRGGRLADGLHTLDVANAYLRYLYSPEGQEIIARHFYRPRDPAVLKKHVNEFPKVRLFTITDVFGGWGNAQRIYFRDGGVFDQIYGG